jgi:hypothetical protein
MMVLMILLGQWMMPFQINKKVRWKLITVCDVVIGSHKSEIFNCRWPSNFIKINNFFYSYMIRSDLTRIAAFL